MSFKIWEEKKKEKEVFFKLEMKVPMGLSDPHVFLVVCDADGNIPIIGGYIFYFTKDGKITRCESVNPTLGLQLDSKGRVLFND